VASGDALKIAFFVILFLALVIAIYGHYTAPPHHRHPHHNHN